MFLSWAGIGIASACRGRFWGELGTGGEEVFHEGDFLVGPALGVSARGNNEITMPVVQCLGRVRDDADGAGSADRLQMTLQRFELLGKRRREELGTDLR